MAKSKHWKSPDEKPRKKNYWAIVFLVFLVIGLSSSFIFFGFDAGGHTIEYNDVTFRYQGNYWSATIDGQVAAFTFPPDVVDSIELDDAVLPVIARKIQMDLTSNSNDTLAGSIASSQYDLSLTLGQYGVFVRAGYTNNFTGFPIITCADGTSSVPVLLFEQANETKVSAENNCVKVQASTDQQMVMAKDRLLYTLFGVM